MKINQSSEIIRFMNDEPQRIKDHLKSNQFRLLENDLQLGLRTILRTFYNGLKKDATTSKNYRTNGNLFFKMKHSIKVHIDIWRSYSLCILTAPYSSIEFAQGFYNRASFFLHLKKYTESLKDIEIGLQCSACTENLRIKLHCLKIDCFIKINDRQEAESCINQSMQLLFKCNLDEKTKLKYRKILEQAKNDALAIKRKPKTTPETSYEKFKEKMSMLSDPHEKIPCASNALDLKYDEKFGRHVVATRDIKIGELLVKEKFYSTHLTKNEVMRHCWHCGNVVYSSIPCPDCAYAMFCSEKCQQEAWNEYHDIECKLARKLEVRDTLNGVNGMLFCTKTLMKILREVGGIELLKLKLEELDKCSGMYT